ncbi:hypothetical protein [Dulcicalothrix desertica]|uniref:hypothetical protein n=1 Tax=Dulcicalothrix desertica TaxID=32056 RepID=UPI0011A6D587|nr:hypothetical protein [Dulcicalothrix desertica]
MSQKCLLASGRREAVPNNDTENAEHLPVSIKYLAKYLKYKQVIFPQEPPDCWGKIVSKVPSHFRAEAVPDNDTEKTDHFSVFVKHLTHKQVISPQKPPDCWGKIASKVPSRFRAEAVPNNDTENTEHLPVFVKYLKYKLAISPQEPSDFWRRWSLKHPLPEWLRLFHKMIQLT